VGVDLIVGGDRAIGIDAEHLAQAVGQGLGVGAVGVLADGDVELVVGAEVHGAAVVVGGAAEVVQVHQHRLAARDGGVAGAVDVGVGVGVDRGEAADPVVRGGGR